MIMNFATCAIVGASLVGTPLVPEKTAIVIPQGLPPYREKALLETAMELKTHLDLISGGNFALVSNGTAKAEYVIHVGEVPPGEDEKSFKPEEARWRVGEKEAWFYGSAWHGTEYAVTTFLEDELGVRWPWLDEISFTAQNPIYVKHPRGSFLPPVPGHNFRRMRWDPAPVWVERMRRGAHDLPNYGHAFTGYGKRFAWTHPEWFAMRKDGKRLPPGVDANETDPAKYVARMDRMSMCLTASGLVEQVVADWKKAGARDWINCCDNDVYGDMMCKCPNCEALKCGPAPTGIKGLIDYYSDLSVHFAKRVVAEARKVNPKVRGCVYAYNGTERAPQRERIANNELAVMIVPTRFSRTRIRELISGWKAAGFRDFGIRPNRHSYYRIAALSIGSEKYFYDVWQYEYKEGAKWFDYDTAQRNYAIEFFRDYVLLKAMQDPTKSFAHWEDHYMSAFGAAKEDVKAYFRYWREEVWEKRIEPNLEDLEIPGYVIRRLLDNLGKYYAPSDFSKAGAFIDRALERRDLSADDRRRVEALKVCNDGALLFFKAVVNKDDKDRKSLFEFRKRHDIPTVMWEENYIHDITGLKKYLYDNGLAEEVPEYIRKKDKRK